MANSHPHWPEGQAERILELPTGHWFFQAYDRFTRTPEPQEISAPEPPPGLVRPTDAEVMQVIDQLLEEARAEGEAGRQEMVEEGPRDGWDVGEHCRVPSNVTQSTDSITVRLTVEEPVVPDVSADPRVVNHAIVEDPVVPLHRLNGDVNLDMPMPEPPQVRLPAIRLRVDPDSDIVYPHDVHERNNLVRMFRDEILRDWVNDMLAADGLGQFRLAEGQVQYDAIDQIIRAFAAQHGIPYVGTDAIIHHHWMRGSFEAEYDIVIGHEFFRGTAEQLEPLMCGLRYAL